MVIDNNFYMNLALREAWKYQFLTYPNPAVGALILDDCGEILAIEAHQYAGGEHAELKAVKTALIKYGDRKLKSINSPSQVHDYIITNYQNHFRSCTIYVTLEPCNHHGSTPPCSLLIEKLGFKKVVCATLDKNKIASGGLERLKKSGIEVLSGILEDECNELIYPFLKWKKNEPFVFFKIALTLNGVYTGGIISNERSRKLVHQFRDKIDLLVISGQTVRDDRPTLDARMINGKAPDILILSKNKDFDKSIALFKVKNRKVFIENNLDKISSYKFIMIEGGDGMLKETSNIVDWLCFFRSSKITIGKTLQLEKDFRLLHSNSYDNNTIEWLK